ncbi:MAG: hypothetical protein JO166_16535 [Deltaproteobacteria bacterium]|nr:hypothetical protein [Deltaproteobacteria bacterium]
MERKLTTILCADVYGYSRLMGEDEEATLAALKSHRGKIDTLIHEHHGRFVNSAGDSVLAEFVSVGSIDLPSRFRSCRNPSFCDDCCDIAGTVAFVPKLASDSAAMRPPIDMRFLAALYAAKYSATKMRLGGSITFMSGTTASGHCRELPWQPRPAAQSRPSRDRSRWISRRFASTPCSRSSSIRLSSSSAKSVTDYRGIHSRWLPVERPGRPEEIADAVLFLMKNGFVTRITLMVDGGGVLT